MNYMYIQDKNPPSFVRQIDKCIEIRETRKNSV